MCGVAQRIQPSWFGTPSHTHNSTTSVTKEGNNAKTRTIKTFQFIYQSFQVKKPNVV